MLGDRFEIVRTLGRGGMGVVYEAIDKERNSRVALKTMQHVDGTALYRFKREFRALADVAHPNLVALHELLSDDSGTYFTMELVDGLPLVEHLRGGVANPEAPTIAASEGVPSQRTASSTAQLAPDLDRLRDAFVQLSEGVLALHAAGRLHRDLKPSNVLVTRNGRVVVLDFGLVTSRASDQQSVEHALTGTPEYMSPEQAAGSELDEASDWYAVGVMLYEMLTGVRPFVGAPLKILLDKQQRDVVPPSQIVAGVPEEIERLCLSLLAREPEKRATGRAVIDTLGTASAMSHRSSSKQRTAVTIPTLSTTLIGRDAELATLEEALKRTERGKPVVVHIRGAAGLGRTKLAQHFCELLRLRDGPRVLAGRCHERESIAYAGLDEMFDQLSAHWRKLPSAEASALLPLGVAALSRLFPVLGRVEVVSTSPRRGGDVPDRQELRRRAFRAARDLFARLSMSRPLVLWLDDFHWGDADSVALLGAVLAPPEPPPLLLLVGERNERSEVIEQLEAAIAAAGDVVESITIELGPLRASDAKELAKQALGDGSEAEAALIAHESAGSPLFVEELVRHVRSGASVSLTTDGTGTRLEAVLAERIREMSPEAVRLLSVVALAGSPIPREVAAEAAALEGTEEVTALALLRTARLVRNLRSADRYEIDVYHARIRGVVLAQLNEDERTTLHRRIGVAWQGSGRADPSLLVNHFLRAGDRSRAGELAAAAAERASEALAFERAARLWRQARELQSVNGESARSLRRREAEALANAGLGVEAAEAFLAACEGASAAEQLELRRRGAEQLLRCGELKRGVDALREVLSAVDLELWITPFAAIVLLLFNHLLLRLRGLGYVTRDQSQLTSEELTRIDVCWVVGAALAVVHPIPAKIYQKRHLVWALRAGETHRITRGLALEATTEAIGGPSTKARVEQIIARAGELQKKSNDPYLQGWMHAARSMTSYFRGDFATAIAEGDQGVTVFTERCAATHWEMSNIHIFSGWALFHLGSFKELSRRVEALTHEARQRRDLYVLTNMRIGLNNVVWLAADDAERATRELDSALRDWGSSDLQVQLYHETVARSHIHLYAGRPREALALLHGRWREFRRAHLFRIQTVHLYARHLRARAALAAHRESGDRELLAQARADIRFLEKSDADWAHPLAAMLSATIEEREGRRTRAIELLDSAIRELEARKMRLWAAAARVRRAELRDGHDEIAEAAFVEEGVLNVRAMTEMLVPAAH